MSDQDLPQLLRHHGVTIIDTGYMRPGFTASYLFADHGKAAFIETGPHPAVPRLMRALEEQGLSREAVEYVIVSHIHLDHAGAAGELIRLLPNARLVVHPRGATHMIDPSKLTASALEVYGPEVFATHLETIVPVPAERMIEMSDGQTLTVGERVLTLYDTPGHAKHHLCVWDEAARLVYTGDTMGISYREFDTPSGIFIFPATTPVQFDPVTIHKSIDRIAALQPEWACLTHFGPIRFNRWLADDLHRQIDRLKALALGARQFAKEERHERLVQGIEKVFASRLGRIDCAISMAECTALLKPDIHLNAQGLEAWLDRQFAPR